MGHRARLAVLALAGAVLVLSATGGAARTSGADPKEAAAKLIRSLQPNYAKCDCESSASKVVSRGGKLWFAYFDRRSFRTWNGPERLRIYRWTGMRWTRDAAVSWRGWGVSGGASGVTAVHLTGSRTPDFSIAGCGAADTICLSVVSFVGGRWHVVPFEYGYGRALVVNGFPEGDFVRTQVDACSCAGGPSTFMYERYARGMFRPALGPGKGQRCSRIDLEATAGVGTVATLQFDHVACASDWALAAGTGVGYDGPVVGLFNRIYGHPARWRLISLDNGLSLPTASGIYDLPPALLLSLERKLGPSFTLIVDATRLARQLHGRYRGSESVGVVRARHALWLVAVGRERPSFGAVFYRWHGRRWRLQGGIDNEPALRGFLGAWFVSVPRRGGVAFARAGSGGIESTSPLSDHVITNAGGVWHVAPRR